MASTSHEVTDKAGANPKRATSTGALQSKASEMMATACASQPKASSHQAWSGRGESLASDSSAGRAGHAAARP